MTPEPATDTADNDRPSRRARAKADTRMTLILTAERIFAEEGVSNTPLRRITQEAGQRNESAIHYHFGSREGIVAAIMDFRTAPINAARVALLEEMRAEAGGGPLSSRDVAEALSGPLADHLRQHAGKSHYIRFLGVLWLDQPMWRAFMGRHIDVGLSMGLNALLESKPHMPAAVMRQRYGLAIQMGTYALARMERFANRLGDAYDWSRADAEIAGIIDAETAIFDAPLSPRTVCALTESGALAPA